MSNPDRRQIVPRRRGETGQTIIIVAFAAIALFAMIGLAIDAGRLYVTRAELSRSVDSAALSGILEFDGTTAGLSNGEDKAEDYFYENEGADDTTLSIVSDGAENEMTVDATKTVDLLFMPVLGIDTATVSAHAKAGFGVNFLDAVLVLDATPSMAGNPIEQAVDAAGQFKDILLGTTPEGNVSVGVTAFRGCFRPSPITHSECVLTTGSDRWLEPLSDSHSTLEAVLENIADASGGASVGTNVCTGLAMGWNLVSDTSLNHSDSVLYPDNRQFLVLLSDGDNYYSGDDTYQAPYYTSGAYDANSSPTGTTVGGTVYPCQPIDDAGSSPGAPCPAPWNSPSIGSSYPCYKGVFSPLTTIASDNFNGSGSNCPGNWNSGSGWASTGWTASSSPAPSRTGSDNPNDTSCHVRFPTTASLCRTVDLTDEPGARLNYTAKREGDWESSDHSYLEVSTSSNACSTGSGFTVVQTFDEGDLSSSNHRDFTENLDSYVGSVVSIRFRNATSSSDEEFFVDSIEVEGGSSGSPNGYLNGVDGSSPANCATQQTPRERQMDVRTLQLANAIKAQGVEIYVVAFAGEPGIIQNCYLGQPVSYDQTDPADCGLITDNASYPVGASGPDGYTNPDTPNPNVRLLQCISSPNTADHYFYAETAEDLPQIFTQIATQIAHRLIE